MCLGKTRCSLHAGLDFRRRLREGAEGVGVETLCSVAKKELREEDMEEEEEECRQGEKRTEEEEEEMVMI